MLIDFSVIDTLQKQNLMHGAVVPRPIGLISTVDRDGVPNLAPFSFFNVVSVDPPILIFSPLRRLRDNTTKHTLENIREVPEAVVHIVSYPILQQMNIAACEYSESVDEFVKAGFVREKAIKVKPWMIKQCGVKFECKIKEMRSMGSNGGAGTICFAEVLCIHIDSKILDEENQIDPLKLMPVARLGNDFYCTITAENLFRMSKPNRHLGIGFDGLPAHILKSSVLSANDLGQLAMVNKIPSLDGQFSHIAMLYALRQPVSDKRTIELHQIAKKLLGLNLVEEAWQVLLRVNMAEPTLEDLGVMGQV
jgi:flavin reductase (DIM6/NTAB) family NADH-FMN oxidoreductase RutF